MESETLLFVSPNAFSSQHLTFLSLSLSFFFSFRSFFLPSFLSVCVGDCFFLSLSVFVLLLIVVVSSYFLRDFCTKLAGLWKTNTFNSAKLAQKLAKPLLSAKQVSRLCLALKKIFKQILPILSHLLSAQQTLNAKQVSRLCLALSNRVKH